MKKHSRYSLLGFSFALLAGTLVGAEGRCDCQSECKETYLENRGHCPGPTRECLQEVITICGDNRPCGGASPNCYLERDQCIQRVFDVYQACLGKCKG